MNTLFLAGPHGSGKTLAGSHLRDFHGFQKFDLGPILRAKHADECGCQSLGHWVRQGEKAHGPNFTNEVLLEYIQKGIKPDTSNCVIVGNRSLGGLQFLKTALDGYGPARVIFLSAPFETLHRRYNTREGTPISEDEFRRLLEHDSDMGLDEIQKIADLHIFNDDTVTEERLFEAIVSVCTGIQSETVT